MLLIDAGSRNPRVRRASAAAPRPASAPAARGADELVRLGGAVPALERGALLLVGGVAVEGEAVELADDRVVGRVDLGVAGVLRDTEQGVPPEAQERDRELSARRGA
ncbi:MAG: hypothetical protein U1F30_05870 [Steroidobacteraceae bacterium]